MRRAGEEKNLHIYKVTTAITTRIAGDYSTLCTPPSLYTAYPSTKQRLHHRLHSLLVTKCPFRVCIRYLIRGYGSAGTQFPLRSCARITPPCLSLPILPSPPLGIPRSLLPYAPLMPLSPHPPGSPRQPRHASRSPTYPSPRLPHPALLTLHQPRQPLLEYRPANTAM